MSTANELLAAACASGISCLDEMNLLRVIAQGANAGGGGGGGGGGTLSTDGTFAANSDLLYPSQKAAKTYIDTGLAGKQNSLGFTPENVANKSTDGTFAANSDTLYPSQKAAKTYVDNSISTAGGAFVLKAGDTMTGALILPVGSAAAPSLGVGGTTSGLLRPAANQLGISTAGTQRMVVDAAGLVGIGITAPLARLHVTPGASGTDYFRIDHSDGTPRLQVGVYPGIAATAGLWFGSVVPSTLNYTVASDGGSVLINGLTINLRINGDAIWQVNSSGHFLAGTDNTYNIGATGASRPANVNVGTKITTLHLTQTAGGLFSVTSGANQRAGNATLVAGTVTVSNTTVTANTIVLLTRKSTGGTIGFAVTYTVSAATSFTISSDNVLDTSTYSYLLIEVP